MGVPMPDDVLDFSSNVNPLEWPGKMEVDIKKTLSSYPDDEASEIRSMLAEQNGCSPDNILVTSGTNESIYIISSYQEAKANSILQPVYCEYARALDAYGASVRNICSVSELEAGCETVWICNPCNPTGAFIPDEEMKTLFSRFQEKLFIIDEAYKDFLYKDKSSLRYEAFKNVIALRSLTKIFHLCGARIGYIVAQPEMISKLRLRQPTWSVNSLAQTAAAEFLKDSDFPRKTREYCAAEVPRFAGMIRSAGYNVLPTSVNFFLVETKDDVGLMRFLLTRGLVVRHTRNFPGLDGKYVRIAVRAPRENDRLAEAMKEYMTR